MTYYIHKKSKPGTIEDLKIRADRLAKTCAELALTERQSAFVIVIDDNGAYGVGGTKAIDSNVLIGILQRVSIGLHIDIMKSFASEDAQPMSAASLEHLAKSTDPGKR